uniref:Sodium channel modifier 1 n=1 Tax=Rousettus aegyptiacus TaxID=9407 RepID=A0A7J8BHI0_ROUAE|nr:sodium channel modifier 1 [Rousettus aegyptiacus]
MIKEFRGWESQEKWAFSLLLVQTDSCLPRPETPRPPASRSPLPPPPEVELQSGKISRDSEPGAGPQAESAPASSAAPVSPTRRRALDRYLTLRSSGWIPDGRGRWVKDENVEFDSDEEEPPDPPLD